MFIARDSSPPAFKRNQNKFAEIREPFYFLFLLPPANSSVIPNGFHISPVFPTEETLSKTPFTCNQRRRGAERGICHHPQDRSKGQAFSQGSGWLSSSAFICQPLRQRSSSRSKEPDQGKPLLLSPFPPIPKFSFRCALSFSLKFL